MRLAALPFARFARLRRHASHSELVAFQCASLGAADAHRIARHVAACDACSTELSRIREDLALLDDTFRLDAPLAAIAAEDWHRLAAAIPLADSAHRPSPEVLAAYLGNYVGAAAAAQTSSPLEVLETLLGVRASTAMTAGAVDAKAAR